LNKHWPTNKRLDFGSVGQRTARIVFAPILFATRETPWIVYAIAGDTRFQLIAHFPNECVNDAFTRTICILVIALESLAFFALDADSLCPNLTSLNTYRRLRAVSFFAPSRPVFHNPINQCTFKTYVVASFLAFNPFVTKDLSAFG
jgi:hypothetical protein